MSTVLVQRHVVESPVGSTRVIETCDVCNGAGLQASMLGHMSVAVCDCCNGHGKVVVYEWVDANLGEVIRRVAYTH